MDETPEEWLENLYEFEFCQECGFDAEDHEVCIVPVTGSYFARCLRPNEVGPPVRRPTDTSAGDHFYVSGAPDPSGRS